MKDELDVSLLSSPDNLKKSATSLRRLKGGIESEVKRAEFYGLTDKEINVLTEAKNILGSLASLHARAATKKTQQRAAQDKAEKLALEAMKSNFLTLKSLAEKVCLIGMTLPVYLREDAPVTLDRVDFYFKESVEHIAYRIASSHVHEGCAIQGKADELWQKFQDKQAEFKSRYDATIKTLSQVSATSE